MEEPSESRLFMKKEQAGLFSEAKKGTTLNTEKKKQCAIVDYKDIRQTSLSGKYGNKTRKRQDCERIIPPIERKSHEVSNL